MLCCAISAAVHTPPLPHAAGVGVGAGAAATVTVAFFDTDPPPPVHASVYVFDAVRLLCACVPLVAFAPLHAPLAVHEVAFVAFHVSVALLPEVTDVGDMESVRVGAGVTAGAGVVGGAVGAGEVATGASAVGGAGTIGVGVFTARVPLLGVSPVDFGELFPSLSKAKILYRCNVGDITSTSAKYDSFVVPRSLPSRNMRYPLTPILSFEGDHESVTDVPTLVSVYIAVISLGVVGGVQSLF